jgi:hypothetical protein
MGVIGFELRTLHLQDFYHFSPFLLLIIFQLRSYIYVQAILDGSSPIYTSCIARRQECTTIQLLLVEMGSHALFAWAGLKLPPPTLYLAKITGMSHCAWFFKKDYKSSHELHTVAYICSIRLR